MLHRDLEGLGLSEEQLFDRAKRNMTHFVSQIAFEPLGDEGVDSRILHLKSAGAAPSLLSAEMTHEKLFEWFESSDGSDTGHLVAAIPQTDTLLCCRARDREATARLVGYGWSIFGDELKNSIPLTIRSFSISAPGDVKFEDMGRTEDDLKGWNSHSMGDLVFRCPEDWGVHSKGEGNWDMASNTQTDGPSIEVLVVANGTDGPSQIHEMAVEENGTEGEKPIAFGFFNAIPWVRVDSGQADGVSRSKLFVGASGQVLMVSTAIPGDSAMPDIMTMQKVLTSMHSV
ncbi:MAG TPA: hypothetical protein EYN66_12645 [Myxococcales bacterium]|nr:hypothetical protein [Myxococcales bacterium]